ncbi:MAG: esterase/lipase family protein [Thermodesulfobacteriota bacterium]
MRHRIHANPWKQLTGEFLSRNLSADPRIPRSLRRAGIRVIPAMIALLLIGCATPVGVRSIDPKQVQRNLTASILSGDQLSATTRQILNRAGLDEQFEDQPEEVIAALHKGLPTASESDRLFALAELSYAHAIGEGTKPYFFATAVYAYAFLFPEDGAAAPQPSDPRLRTALDLYNLSIASALSFKKIGDVQPDADEKTIQLPFGELTVKIPPEEFLWGSFKLTNFVSTADFDVRGLRNRYRWPGIGAPLAASTKPLKGVDDPAYRRIPPKLKVPVTAFLRLDNATEGIKNGKVRGSLEFYTPVEATTVDIQEHKVPLEYECSSALAYTLEGSRAYDVELSALFSGNLSLVKDKARFRDNLFLMAPYRKGLIPVVFVHGTASSPARWAEMFNELSNDPHLWRSYQFWLFTYNTGNPIVYSAGILADGLRNIVKELDPSGEDPALGHMVVIGHSQGGLLTKLMTVDNGTILWDKAFQKPFEELKASEEAKEILRRSLFFKPIPSVKRVVFLATPHKGSYLAGGWVTRSLREFISLPNRLVKTMKEIVKQNPELEATISIDKIARSTDNMDPNSFFVKTLSPLPVSPGITAHSICAVNNPDDPREEWTDGVVDYSSAHLEGVASEFIVHSGHSTQDHPATIEEVRRILLEHLDKTKESLQ